MVSLGAPLENREGMKPSPLVELNPNMLVHDVERMATIHVGVRDREAQTPKLTVTSDVNSLTTY